MSVLKSAKRRQADAEPTLPSPVPKRLKSTATHVPPKSNGLAFLVDENARAGRTLQAKLTNGVPGRDSIRLDESNATVEAGYTDLDGPQQETGGAELIEISSGEEPSDSDSDLEDEEAGGHLTNGLVNGDASAHSSEPTAQASSSAALSGPEELPPHAPMDIYADDVISDDAGDADPDWGGTDSEDEKDRLNLEEQDEDVGDDDEEEEPTFGEILQARHPDMIDTHDRETDAPAQQLYSRAGQSTLTVPTGASLGTVLTQALKTNDAQLLENCFRLTDLASVRATLQRLQSQHVATLLQRIAERIHKKPGRAGNLMVWIQWSLVAHGAYLASQPDLTRKISSLQRVLRERANALQPLLNLKGKLDLLSAQLELRRQMRTTSLVPDANDEDDEDAVVYVEGQEGPWSDSDVEVSKAANDNTAGNMSMKSSRRGARQLDATADSDVSDDMVNGFDSEDNLGDSEDEDDDEEAGLIDDEAEEVASGDDSDLGDSDDEGDEDEDESDLDSAVDEEDEDDVDAAEDSEVEIAQLQRSKLNRKR